MAKAKATTKATARPDGHGFSAAPCTPRALPRDQQAAAAWSAMVLRTDNAPAEAVMVNGMAGRPHPLSMAVVRGRRWPNGSKITVQFLGSGRTETQDRTMACFAEISRFANLDFVAVKSGGTIRVSYDQPGLWAYIGTDHLHVPAAEPTYNLQGFDAMAADDPEWERAGVHEALHCAGAEHEQSRGEFERYADREGLIRFYMADQGWTHEEAAYQYEVAFSAAQLIESAFDPKSLMLYYVPPKFLKTKLKLPGGKKMDDLDRATIAKAYPGRWTPPKPVKPRSFMLAGALGGAAVACSPTSAGEPPANPFTAAGSTSA